MIAFLALRWWVLPAMLVFGALIAAAAVGLISARRPQWSRRRRVIGAALAAPLLILVGTMTGILLTAFDAAADGWGDLARAAMLQIGVWGAALTFLGGVLAASVIARVVEE